MLEGYDIVCIAPGFWDESWLDVHRYMPLLAQSNRVLLVERAITPVSFLTRGQKRYGLKQMQRTVFGTIRLVADNLLVATPPFKLPLRYEDSIIAFNQFFMESWLESKLKSLKMDKPLLWLYEPDSASIVGKLGEAASVYMVTDDYASNPLSLNRASQIRKWDHMLSQMVDLIITTEPQLAEQRRALNPNTHYVSHGVNYEVFSAALDPNLAIPQELANIQEPIIGLVGRVNQRIEMALIEALLQQDWKLVIVGEIGDDEVAKALSAMPEIIFVGYKSEQELPAYLKAMTVCIIPYALTTHTRHMHPLKALEYLAAGKPVVSTSLPALMPHGDMITFADTREDFIAAIQQAIINDTPDAQLGRNRYTASKTWQASLEAISNLIEARLNRR